MEWVLILVTSGGLTVPEIERFPTERACLYAVEQASQMEAFSDSLEWRCYNETELGLSAPDDSIEGN